MIYLLFSSFLFEIIDLDLLLNNADDKLYLLESNNFFIILFIINIIKSIFINNIKINLILKACFKL